ncbi:hypothetical protein RBE51_21035 [Pseudomonas taiwanensis]|uniref:hypothetical protein n=1 Tax=Pseudomonas taiwanensis TaxID=470150 RepID=UPI0028E044A8|nr:hypothetical protein [Pseudomonas taiwanensis]MDT8925282.1 hypothetical protein [Pseudomonas taiwanensis]
MTQPVFTKQDFRQQMQVILTNLIDRDWKSARQNAQQYTQHMNQAFSTGHHQAALFAQEHLQTLREPAYTFAKKYSGLNKERLYRAFVAEHCPLEPWLAAPFLLHDHSGSDNKLVDNILKNGFFRANHLVDEVEVRSEAAPRLVRSLELIDTLLTHNNHQLAAKLIEGLLHDEDLHDSPFSFDNQVVALFIKGGQDLFFRQFLERMAPRIEEICEWSLSTSNRREPCLRASDRPALRELAQLGLPKLALDLYLHSREGLANRDELMLAEQAFDTKLSLWMLASLSQSTKSLGTFAAFVEYFIQDQESRWVFDSDDAVEAMNKIHGRDCWFAPPPKVCAFGDGQGRVENLKVQAVIIQEAFERHKAQPDIESKRAEFMRQYVASHIKVEDEVIKEIRNLYPLEYLMDIPGFPESRLQEELGL